MKKKMMKGDYPMKSGSKKSGMGKMSYGADYKGKSGAMKKKRRTKK